MRGRAGLGRFRRGIGKDFAFTGIELDVVQRNGGTVIFPAEGDESQVNRRIQRNRFVTVNAVMPETTC